MEETIRSVILQGYPNLQYIVMDGASRDDSIQIIDLYSQWISHSESELDNGQVDALNRGFAKADGDFLGFLNSDDILTEGAISESIMALAAKFPRSFPSKVVIAGAVVHFSVDGDGYVGENRNLPPFRDWLLGRGGLQQPGTLWSRELWTACGPLPRFMNYAFDAYFFALMSAHEPEFVRTEHTVARFRLHDLSKSVSQSNRFESEWNSSVKSLLRRAPMIMRLRVEPVRWQMYAQSAASRAMIAPNATKGFSLLLSDVLRRPYILTARPVLGAIWRLGRVAIRSLLRN